MLSRVALSLLGVCLLVVLVRTKTNFKRNNVQNLIERLAMEKQTISAKRQSDGTMDGAMNGIVNGTENGTMNSAINGTKNGTTNFAMNDTMNEMMNDAMNGTENGTMDDKGKKDDDDKKGKGKKNCDCDDDDEKKHAEYLAWWNYQLELFDGSPPWFTFYDFLKDSTKEKIKLGAQVDCAEDDYNCLYNSFLEYYFAGNPWWWDEYNFQPNWLTYDVGLVEYFGGVVPFWYNEEGPSYGFDEGFALWAHLTINIMQDFLHSYVVETCFGEEPKPEDFGWLEEYGYIGESSLDVAKGRWKQLKDFFSWDVRETCLWLPFVVFKE